MKPSRPLLPGPHFEKRVLGLEEAVADQILDSNAAGFSTTSRDLSTTCCRKRPPTMLAGDRARTSARTLALLWDPLGRRLPLVALRIAQDLVSPICPTSANDCAAS